MSATAYFVIPSPGGACSSSEEQSVPIKEIYKKCVTAAPQMRQEMGDGDRYHILFSRWIRRHVKNQLLSGTCC